MRKFVWPLLTSAAAYPRLLLGAVLSAYCISLSALELPNTTPVPGGVAVLPLGTDRLAPRLSYQQRPVMTLQVQGRWWALVGIPLDAKPGLHTIERRQSNRTLDPLPLFVEPKQYRAQYITLRNSNMVDPDAKTLARINREAAIRRRALNTFSPQAPATLRFALPARGRFSSEFGLRRFFNNKPRRPHSGLDIAAPRGTAVTAPAPGRVIATGNYFFNGNTVFLDHGQGLVTMYCHLDSITVTEQQQVTTGQALGTVGSTGRATGPHLHWGVALSGVMVEPRLFLE